jgi:hypothetical protein
MIITGPPGVAASIDSRGGGGGGRSGSTTSAGAAVATAAEAAAAELVAFGLPHGSDGPLGGAGQPGCSATYIPALRGLQRVQAPGGSRGSRGRSRRMARLLAGWQAGRQRRQRRSSCSGPEIGGPLAHGWARVADRSSVQASLRLSSTTPCDSGEKARERAKAAAIYVLLGSGAGATISSRPSSPTRKARSSTASFCARRAREWRHSVSNSMRGGATGK